MPNSKIVYTSILLIFILFFLSCKRKKEIEPVPQPPKTKEGLLIGNEGNFNWGNASLSFYDTKNKKIYNEVYKSANNHPLGDVLQSITVDSNVAYLVINNSGKIEKIDLKTFKTVKTYTGFNSPRYINVVGNKGYVSDLYENCVYVINLKSEGNNSIIKKINIPSWTEEMTVYENYLYVAGVTTNKVYIINTVLNDLVDSINVADAPMSLDLDKNNLLWVYAGDYQSSEYTLQQIDITTKEIVFSHPFVAQSGTMSYATKMCMSPQKDYIYLIYNGIQQIDVSSKSIETLIDQNNFVTPYGIGTDIEGNIYVADAKDYVSRGEVSIFHPNGRMIKKITVGIIPGSFAYIKIINKD